MGIKNWENKDIAGCILGWAQNNIRLLATAFSLFFVIIWTLLRFFSTASTYDLTTQQVLAHSWLHGYTGHVVLGPTNYLLKIFLLYMPADLLPGSPRLKLIILAILVNIITFILLFWAIKKILAEFKIPISGAYWGALLWLGAIAGSVFWIQFTNSRNLEAAGGMFLIWAALRQMRSSTTGRTFGLLALAALLFFADGMLIYMVALPLLIYFVVLAFGKKVAWRRAAELFVVFGVGLIIACALTALTKNILNFSISGAGANHLNLTFSSVGHSFVDAVKSTLRQLGGGVDAGRWREAINLLFLVGAVASFVVCACKRKIPRRFCLLIFVFVVTDELVYVASGEALQSDTSRYLIMISLIAVLALASLSRLFAKPVIPYAVLGFLVVANFLSLGKNLHAAWNTNFPQDSHLASVARYLNNHNYPAAFGSMDTSTPLAYYGGVKNTLLVPVACLNNQLVHAYAFRDTHLVTPQALGSKQVPIILDQGAISNAPNSCTRQSIVQQLGAPSTINKLDDGSDVLIFPAPKIPTNLCP